MTHRRAPARPLLLALALLVGSAAWSGVAAQQHHGQASSEDGPEMPKKIEVPLDTAWTSQHTVTMADGREIPYTATVGWMPVYDENREAVASVFYTYYRRSDVQDRTNRPLTFSFNGGPGSGSLWMHLGYTGPRKLKISENGYPVQPYGWEENPHTILDRTDIVYVNPVNTGFSRAVEGADMDQFFGVEDDVEYLAEWIGTFVSRNARWTSPKYLIGESYGTTRVSGLSRQLQQSEWIYVNGVALVSPTGLGLDREGPVGDALKVPHYAATAWYYDQLPDELQSMDLTEELLPEVEQFTVQELIPALTRGGSLPDARREEIAEQVARYAAVSPEYVEDWNLAVPVSSFRKELLRDQGYTVGRLDSRYRGVDRTDAGEYYDYSPELESWNHAFTPAANEYLREELGVETDLQYWTFGPTPNWEREPNETGENLREAMATNPFMHVIVQSGYYDGATDYFAAKYTMWQIDPSGKFMDRLRFEGYRSGHMMYLREADRETSNQDLREWIEDGIPADTAKAKYPGGGPPRRPGGSGSGGGV